MLHHLKVVLLAPGAHALILRDDLVTGGDQGLGLGREPMRYELLSHILIIADPAR